MPKTGQTTSTSNIAAVLNLTPRRVQQLAKEGMPTAGRGEWPVIECIHWYIEYLKSQQALEPSFIDEKIRVERARAEKIEMENRTRRGELVKISEVIRRNSEILVALRGALLGLPGRLALQVSQIDNAGEVKRVLSSEIRSILNIAAGKINEFADFEEGGGDLDGQAAS